MSKKVLVVGGAGFIGAQVNKMLNTAGYQTIVLDNLSRGDKRTVVKGEIVHGDLADINLLDELFKKHKFIAVFHFAALIDVGESVSHPAKYYYNNVYCTLNLLEAMKNHGVDKLIFSSTASIYGHPQYPQIAEDHPCNPINPYGRSKWMVETILKDFEQAFGLKYCCLRYFNAAGGDPDGEIKSYNRKETNLIPIILKKIQNSQDPVTIFGTDYPTHDGTCIRDYIHIVDLANAHILSLKQLLKTERSDIFNLGNGQGFSVKEVIKATEKVTGHKIAVIEGPRRQGDPPRLVADSQKAQRLLHWRPQFSSLETIISHAWNSML